MVTYTEKRVLDSVEFLPETGIINVREADKVYKDDVEISSIPHRYVLFPGDDLTAQDSIIKSIAALITSDQIADQQAKNVAEAARLADLLPQDSE